MGADNLQKFRSSSNSGCARNELPLQEIVTAEVTSETLNQAVGTSKQCLFQKQITHTQSQNSGEVPGSEAQRGSGIASATGSRGDDSVVL